jgi:hypothetical protein
MMKLLERTSRKITQPLSTIAFSTTGDGDVEVWDRFLTVNGKQAYHLGNICGTCSFCFERMEGANAGIDVGELTTLLSKGLSCLSQDIVDKIAQLLPQSDYIVSLFKLQPELVQLSGQNDYFAVEQVQNEDGVDFFWGLPHYPKVPYYRVEGRSGVKILDKSSFGAAFDFIVPMFPETFLQSERITHYENALQDGLAPTAVALSVLDIKGPAFSGIDHWCLAHYVLDGHHKVAAAARAQRELTLVSFIAVDHGISSKQQIEIALKSYPRSL